MRKMVVKGKEIETFPEPFKRCGWRPEKLVSFIEEILRTLNAIKRYGSALNFTPKRSRLQEPDCVQIGKSKGRAFRSIGAIR